MTSVEITLLCRATLDEQYAEIWTGTATLNSGTTMVAPVVPPAAAGQDLAVLIHASGGSVNFASFTRVTPEAAEGDPLPAPRLERVSSVYGAFAGQARRAPFCGTAIGFCSVGTPQPAA